MSIAKEKLNTLLEEDAQQIYLGNLKTVEFDLDLPVKGRNGSTIQWHSADERWINNQGIVGRPPFGRGNRVVALTATLTLENESLDRVFEVRILEAENDIQVAEVYPVRLTVKQGETFYLPTAVAIRTENGRILSHYVTWDQPEAHILDGIGEAAYQGVIKGTDYPVIAMVECVATLVTKKEREKRKQVVEIDKIRLLPSPMKYIQDQRLTYLLAQNDDQMLYNFRVAAGLDTLDAPEMIGWDSPESKLRGHTTGHYLSALALAYAATGNQEVLSKLSYMIQELGKVQQKFKTVPGVKAGFISGYDETQFDLLEQYKPYPEIWAPYYTLHKIFAGLLDSFHYAGIQEALTIADQLGDWVYARLSRLSHHQLQEMWGMYIAGEFGGMNESLAELYQYTNKPEHLAAAKLFDNDRLYFPMSQKVDALGGLHANQHIPQIVGTMAMYEASQEECYYQISEFFWDAVVNHHSYSMGGTGDGELFQQPDYIASHLSKNTAENCASYNMLKLTKNLYQYHPSDKYLAYYENVMLNHILATPDHDCGGESTYFMATQPGAQRFFEVENSCCHGTGMENHFKYGSLLASYDEDYLDIHYYLPCKIADKVEDYDLTITTSEDWVSEITVEIESLGVRHLRLRKPVWAEKLVFIVNGKEQALTYDGEFYIVPTGISKILIKPQLIFQMVSAPDDQTVFSIFVGPFLMAALSEEQTFLQFSTTPETLANQLQPKGQENHYFLEGVELIPVYQLDQEHYHLYFKKR